MTFEEWLDSGYQSCRLPRGAEQEAANHEPNRRPLPAGWNTIDPVFAFVDESVLKGSDGLSALQRMLADGHRLIFTSDEPIPGFPEAVPITIQ